jgi:predicted O-methyltransferase YrrM
VISDDPAMPLPQALRRLTPNRVKNSERLRSVALGAGLIPPRPMHSADEAALLAKLAAGRRVVLEIGTYEGSSAVVLVRAMPADATLHLVDSYEGNALLFGWQGAEGASRRLLARETRRRGGPIVHWHVARSLDVAAGWTQPLDMVFIDAGHTEAEVRSDWDAWHPHVLPGGAVAFHDARSGHPGGPHPWPGPTAVVDALFRGQEALAGWRIVGETGSLVAVERRLD